MEKFKELDSAYGIVRPPLPPCAPEEVLREMWESGMLLENMAKELGTSRTKFEPVSSLRKKKQRRPLNSRVSIRVMTPNSGNFA